MKSLERNPWKFVWKRIVLTLFDCSNKYSIQNFKDHVCFCLFVCLCGIGPIYLLAYRTWLSNKCFHEASLSRKQGYVLSWMSTGVKNSSFGLGLRRKALVKSQYCSIRIFEMYFLWLCGQGSVLWSFMGGIHRSPMKSPYTGQAVPRFSFNVISLDKLLCYIAKLLHQISIRYLSSYGIYTSANTSNFITRFYLWWQQTMQINTATVVANQATIVAQKLTFFAFHWSTSKSNLKSWRRHPDGFHQNVHRGAIIKSLKNGAPGSDGITAQILKTIRQSINGPVCYLCNRSLTEGVFPDELKLANVLPLFKSGDPLLFNNFRPVSLLCVLSKVFEKVMYSRLINFLEQQKILIKKSIRF